MVILMLVLVQDFGIVGLIMAPPIAAAIQILFNHLVVTLNATPITRPDSEIDKLLDRFDRMKEYQAQNGEPPSPALENLSNRLSKLLVEASQITAQKNRSGTPNA